jgi:hypothetical protein
MSQIGQYDRTTVKPDIELLVVDTGDKIGPNALGELFIRGGTNINTTGNPAVFETTINLDDNVVLLGTLTSTGITVNGFTDGPIWSDAAGNFYVNESAGIVGTATTVGAVNATAILVPLGVAASTFAFEVCVAAHEATTPASAGYQLFGVARTDGAAGTLVGTVDQIANEDAAINTGNATIVVVGNDAIVRVTGVAGLTINWTATLRYTTT